MVSCYGYLSGRTMLLLESFGSRFSFVGLWRNVLSIGKGTTIGTAKGFQLSTLTGTEIPTEKLSDNDEFSLEFINRNPRNLEQMFLAKKPQGFALEWPSITYWHKVLLEKSSRHTTAKVIHNTGKVVVSVSTREWNIKKQLYSTTDVSAAENVARVLAQRCLESGIMFVHKELKPKEENNSSLQIFLKTLEEEGLILKEPEPIRGRHYTDL
ncbi:39S ribosomal protein L18, mitochondrial-like isoform X3 [Limulus polyphemus]|uniref:39S ribosomal protein L18, mitochondrial-like isoform X1 n=1 Tax=Limulus polyphemus TaxID=6850 RepID=A0ABM1BS53_LIMPO|nr:39S ribosomal protein L18, mitochondrial-like isoform X1 [Limulus polyphemus]XP_022255871.1 39S ribosomal protein L18, mitochondrial-like isoform X2 [Limulus polyphemus]XP_022255872.1 39S ribosomal protein L18, mitochondrial-like isoform X3 [Limulus polyphemus]